MERRSSDYPISKLIQSTLANSGLRGGEVAHKLGYRNVTGGLRAVDTWLQTGSGHPDALKRLVKEFGLSIETVNEALKKTNDLFQAEDKLAKAKREKRERERFKPYILIEVFNTIPSSGITILAWTGVSVRFIYLDSTYAVLSEDTWSRVQQKVRDHYTQNGGKIMFFGAVSGYRFVPDWDQSWLLSVDGTILEHDPSHFEIPFRATVSLKGRPFPWLLPENRPA
jgi:hypothetical protein